MALQTSGAISLNEIHVEVGGTSGTTCSLNDSDIRGIGAPNATYADAQNGTGINTTSGTAISIYEFYGAADTVPMSTTNYARNTGTADAAFSYRSQTSGIANVQAYLECRLRRTDPYVYLEVRERSSAQTSYWWTSAGTQTTLSTSYVTLGRFNLTGITAIRLDWTTPTSSTTGSGVYSGSCYIAGETNGPSATYNASSGSWVTVSNNQSIAFAFTAMGLAECYAQVDQECFTDITAYARKSGYQDTSLGTYQFTSEAIAISNNCF